MAILIAIHCTVVSQASERIDEYIQTWKEFYPTKAFQKGIHSFIFSFEDYSAESISQWIDFNKNMRQHLQEYDLELSHTEAINVRLIHTQIQKELDQWERVSPQSNSLLLYVNLIEKAMQHLEEAEFLLNAEKSQIASRRLIAVQELCKAAQQNLISGDKDELQMGLSKLKKQKETYKTYMNNEVFPWGSPASSEKVHAQFREAIGSMESLIHYVVKVLIPNASTSFPALGQKAYSKMLAIYSEGAITPEELAAAARQEIDTVKILMANTSRKYLKQKHPHKLLAESDSIVIQTALSDMEKDVVRDGNEYLKFWLTLSDSIQHFLSSKGIVTLPTNNTLQILPAPEEAGPAARIGWVSSAPPFAANPMTTLYLPSIPPSVSKKEREDFWSSFNKPFNRMIVIHELFPGHYMQNKISRESPHSVRLLFPYGPYSEGWGTFVERVVLDEGWNRDQPLTMLAHLRKRLENANRAYTSVQLHCHGWTKEKIIQFSTETSLLAPQFAKSLWGRLVRSPMQMTSYFLGSVQFNNLLQSEKARLGENFILQDFMDNILRAGPISIDEFYRVFEHN